jgi:hypothetical protein
MVNSLAVIVSYTRCYECEKEVHIVYELPPAPENSTAAHGKNLKHCMNGQVLAEDVGKLLTFEARSKHEAWRPASPLFES